MIESNEVKTIIDSDLPWPIRAEESTWSLVPGEHIHVMNRTFTLKVCLSKNNYRFRWKNQWNVGGRIF